MALYLVGAHLGVVWASVNRIPCVASWSRVGMGILDSGLKASESPQPMSSASIMSILGLDEEGFFGAFGAA